MEEIFEGCLLVRLTETDSTNRFLREYDGAEGSSMTVVAADYQTAGKGQGKNSWISERGKNLLFSVKIYPKGLRAARQFILLEAGALAVRDALTAYAGGFEVKWPNDVYRDGMKISGTLSECTVSQGLVASCIMGVGINVNQTVFGAGAPNPVSLAAITGRECDRMEVLTAVLRRMKEYFDMVDDGLTDDISRRYEAALYRRTGFHAYRDGEGRFMAEYLRIEPDGRLTLRRDNGHTSTYGFKEVEFL